MNLKAHLVTFALLATTPSFASAEDFTTADLAQSATSKECLDWCVVGTCFWLVCTPFPPSCTIQTTPQIRHNLPDLVVTSFGETGESPWKEWRALTGDITKELGSTILEVMTGEDIELQGGEQTEISTRERRNLHFFESEIIGNPVAKAADFAPFLCKSKVQALYPYFQSSLDAIAWRSGMPDSLRPEALTPSVKEVGQWPLQTWGSVFPRSGFITQGDEAKAAAVIAQRSADIVTNEGFGHVYTPFGYDGHRREQFGDPRARTSKACKKSGGSWFEGNDNEQPRCDPQWSVQWMPGANEERDRWQMISPQSSQQCESFGSADPFWSEGKTASDAGYGWTYWRTYKCCIPGPGMFLQAVPIPEICP